MKSMKKMAVLAAMVVLSTQQAMAAGTGGATGGGTELTGLQSLLDLIVGFSTGTMGKVIATAMFLVGIAAGIVRQSILAVVAGIGAAAALSFGPSVIDEVFSALI